MQATMLLSQRCCMQPRAASRTAPLASTSIIRATPLAANMATVRTARPVVAQAVVAAAAVEPAAAGAVAHLRFVRGSPMKVRRVLDQIRGLSYEEALMILEYMPYKACEPVIKTLLSAAANAKNNLGLKKKDLTVSECYANEGPILKRFQPRAQGRPFPIHKPTMHLTIKVAPAEA